MYSAVWILGALAICVGGVGIAAGIVAIRRLPKTNHRPGGGYQPRTEAFPPAPTIRALGSILELTAPIHIGGATIPAGRYTVASFAAILRRHGITVTLEEVRPR